MADSIPSLRRKLAEAHARNADLELRKPEVIERVVEVERLVPHIVERIVYHDNPDHIETIRKLQEQLCLYISQPDSLSNQDQGDQLLPNADLQV